MILHLNVNTQTFLFKAKRNLEIYSEEELTENLFPRITTSLQLSKATIQPCQNGESYQITIYFLCTVTGLPQPLLEI